MGVWNYKTAREYGLTDLVDLVFGQVGGLLTTSNIFEIFHTACHRKCPEVVQVGPEFVINNFQELVTVDNGAWQDHWVKLVVLIYVPMSSERAQLDDFVSITYIL